MVNESTKFGEGHGRDGVIKNDKDTVGVEFIGGEFETNGFVETATDAVAANGGLFDFFADNNGEALVVAGIDGINKGKLRGAKGFALAIGISYATTGVETIASL